MLVACWSPKGGTGTTVVSAALAVLLARTSPAGALLVDLAGDLPAALGLPEPAGAGLGEWLAAGPDVSAAALARLELDAAPGVRLLPRGGVQPGLGGPGSGGAAVPSRRTEDLVEALDGERRAVVVDCGAAERSPGLDLALGAGASLLVLRSCYLALRRALAAPARPSGVVLLRERDRSLNRRDVEDVLDVPVVAEVPVEPAIARAVDAGLLGARLPRELARPLERCLGYLVPLKAVG